MDTIVGLNFQELKLIEVIIIKYVLKVIRHKRRNKNVRIKHYEKRNRF